MSKLTFERIKKECKPGEHLLVDNYMKERLYLGFNRIGMLVTDCCDGISCMAWSEEHIEYWTIKPYEPPKEKKRYWRWRVRNPYWFKTSTYYNDDGVDTVGSGGWEDWHSLEKEKMVDDFVDV